MLDSRKYTIHTPDHEIRPFLLTFAGPDVETRFQTQGLIEALPAIRVYFLVGSMLYAAFGVLDLLILTETWQDAWLIRYGIISPCFIGFVLFTYSSLFVRFAQWALAAVMFSAGFGIIAMTAVIQWPGSGLYYAGLMMVVIYCSTLIRLRWTWATVNTVLLVLLYQPVAIWINPIPPSLLLSNNFFLGLALAVGTFSSYVQELHVRREFRNAEMLRAEKERSIELLQEAQTADRAKGEFLGVMSHELRTPLNAIIGFTEIMQTRMFGPLGSDRYAEYVNDINDAGHHLLNIISDVLDFSRAEVGKLSLQEDEGDLRDVVEQACRMLRQKAAEGGLRLSLEVTGEAPVLWMDERLMKQVFINLIGNAIKFTPPGGSIAVAIDATAEGGPAVTVADTGIGIDTADIDKVLQPFAQVETAYSRKHGGTGLGLPFSKRIVETHGGLLTLSSTPGAGTRVAVCLPAERVIRRDATARETA